MTSSNYSTPGWCASKVGSCQVDTQYSMGALNSNIVPLPIFGVPKGLACKDLVNQAQSSIWCPSGYNVDTSKPLSQFGCIDTEIGGILQKVCIGSNPAMPMPSQDLTSTTNTCCLGTESSPNGKCAIGFCPDGIGCASAMVDHAKQFGYDSIMQRYLATTTNTDNKDKIVKALLQYYYGDNPDARQNVEGNKAALEFCKLSPGSCDDTLFAACKSISSIYDLGQDTDLINTCGCHLPARLYYDAYGTITSRACSPPCVLPNTIKTGDGSTPESWVTCSSNVCIIDDVNINVVNSTISGGISITQACPSASDNNTVCYFSNDNINTLNSIVSGNQNGFSSNCKTCYTYDKKNPVGTLKLVDGCKDFGGNTPTPPSPSGQCNKDSDCNKGSTCINRKCVVSPSPPPQPTPTTQTNKIWIIVGIVCAIVILLLLFYFLH